MSNHSSLFAQQQADLLAAAYAALPADPANESSVEPGAELDSALAATVARVAEALSAPAPTAAFAAELQQRLQDAAAKAAAGQPTAARPLRSFDFGARAWRVAAALLLATAVGAYLFSLRPQPVNAQEIVRRAQAALTSPAAAGLQSYFLSEQSTFWASNSIPNSSVERSADGAPVQSSSRTQRWFQAPNRWRVESTGQRYAAAGKPRTDQAWSNTTVSDGSSQYDYDAAGSVVTINVLPAAVDSARSLLPGDGASGVTNLAQLFERMAACSQPQVTSSAVIAGQPVYVVDLGPSLCPSASAPEMNGRSLIWVDKNSFFVLKRELYSTQGDQLLMRSEVTEVAYNPALDAALFTFTPPPGLRILDYRPQALPTVAATVVGEAGSAGDAQHTALLAALQPLTQQVDYPLFAPAAIPDGLTPRLPKLMPSGSDNREQLMLEFVPPADVEKDSFVGQTGIQIMQQKASYDLLVSFTRDATPVLLPGVPVKKVSAWARRGFIGVDGTGSDSAVIVLRDGVLITLSSFAFTAEQLLALAGDLQPVAGSRPALPNPQPPTLDAVRASAPFPIFVPTWLPDGLTAEPPVGYTITYYDHSGQPVLTVANGGGLAGDPRFAGEPVTLSNGLAAHWLGALLWWEQEGVQIALSGADWPRDVMLRIAASMSSSAPLGTVELPPQPTPAPSLPTPTPMPTPAFALLRPTWLPEPMAVREQVEGDSVSMGFVPVSGSQDGHGALTLMQMPQPLAEEPSAEDIGVSDPQASREQIGGHDVTVIRRGANNCVTYMWNAAGLQLILSNVYDPPGQLKYTCDQMQQIVAGIR